MSLVVNTNVSSLTAQRALAYADSLQGEAMTRLSTGSKINSASDDAAGLAIAQRMTAQVNGLNMAIKNANDGISLTQSVEGALVEVSDMLQRMRELSVQAANDTNTGVDRKAIQEEIDLLVAEISRVSSNTRFNNQKVLDGTFINKQIQVGTQGAEVISLSLDSSAADALGAFKVTGDIVQANSGYGSGIFVNSVDADDDIIVNGNSTSRTIDVTLADSAAQLATKINAVAGETGVSAEAKTHAYLYSMSAADETISLKINNHTTGDFTMSSSTVLDAVDKINTISGKTGVTASIASDNRVVLYSNGGSDVLIENEKASTKLRVKTVAFDGSSEVTKQAKHAEKQATDLDASQMHRITNNTTGEVSNFSTGTSEDAKSVQVKINAALGATEGVKAQRVSTSAVTAITDGDYYLQHAPTGDVFKLSVGAKTVADWTTAIAGATYVGGSHDGQTRDLSKMVMATANGTSLQLTGTRVFGDFEVYSDAALSVNIMDKTHAQNRTGVEATGIEVESAAADGTSTDLKGSNFTGAAGDLLAAMNSDRAAAGYTFAASVGTFAAESSLKFIHNGSDETGRVVTITGTDRDDNVISETISLGTAGSTESSFRYKTLTAVGLTGTLGGNLAVHAINVTAAYDFVGAREFGDFDMTDETDYTATILTAGATNIVGDHDTQDYAFGASGGTDAATIQGVLELSSSKTFSITQSGVEEAYSGGPANDNYFTTGAATLSTVSNVDLRSQAGASAAISIIDGAIEKISSMRVSLGAVENRLDHTVSNLMNIAENTESARSRIQDADFASESAKLAKAQVLKQAGVGMLAQANASGQLVLQLLQ